MKEFLPGIFLLFIAMNFSGCAGMFKEHRADLTLSERCRAEALECEKTGELHKALLYWKIISAVNPEDEQVAEKLAQLKSAAESTADLHFKRAVGFYKKKSFSTAQKEFLTALRYNPDHHKALDYLKNRLAWEGCATYKVKKDDTLKDIAREVYRDSGKDFLVAYFMGLETTEKPVQGTIIKLPVLESRLSEQLLDVVKKLTEARDLFEEKNYEEVLVITGQILEYDSENKEAADLQNTSYYQIGKKLRTKRKYFESLEMFKKVDPGYEGVKESISAVNRTILKQAETHYRTGVDHFVNEDLERAIAEWEKTLLLNPEHQKAKRDIKDARNLLEKWKQIK
jgi:tetratricopeptide (TPR) repeat protein